MILQIGEIQFDVDLSYQTLRRAQRWRWDEVKVQGSHPVLQYTGKESSVISFQGVWWNYRAEGDRIESVEALADAGEPLSVTGSNGLYYGLWSIVGVERNEEFFRPTQHSAIKVAFTISMKFYGDSPDRASPIGAPALPSTTSALHAKASISAATAETSSSLTVIGEAADDPDLSDLDSVKGFSALASEAKRDAATLRVSTVPESESLHDLPSSSPFFENVQGVKDILAKRQTTQNKIATVHRTIRELPAYDTLKNLPAMQSLESNLLRSHRSLNNVRAVEKQVDEVLRVKDFVATVVGL